MVFLFQQRGYRLNNELYGVTWLAGLVSGTKPIENSFVTFTYLVRIRFEQ